MVDVGVLVSMPGKRVLVDVAKLADNAVVVGEAVLIGRGVLLANGVLDDRGMVVGVAVVFGEGASVGMPVGVMVYVESNCKVALGGGPVCEGRKVARAALFPSSLGGVQVGGRLFRVGVLVGMPKVGIIVGGGRGLKATWGLMKICAKTMNRATAAKSAKKVKISQTVNFFIVASSFIAGQGNSYQ